MGNWAARSLVRVLLATLALWAPAGAVRGAAPAGGPAPAIAPVGAGAPAAPPAAATPATPSAVPLGTPLFAAVNGDGKVVNFAWWGVKGATGGYEVLRTTDPQVAAERVAAVPGGTLGATDAHPLATGTYYQLVAVGPGGARAAGAWILVNTPTVTGVTASGPDVLIAWSTIRGAPAGYEVWRTADQARAPVRVGSVAAGTLTFTDKQAAGNDNFYQVVALGGGARAASALYPYLPSGALPTAASGPNPSAPAAPVPATQPVAARGAAPASVTAPTPGATPAAAAVPASTQAAATPSGPAPAPASSSAGTATAVCTAPPTPPPAAQHAGYPPYNVYIDANVMMGGICSDLASAADCFDRQAIAYDQAIGVIDTSYDPSNANDHWWNHLTPERGTFERWLSYWGFSGDNTAPVAGEVRALYFNNGDLQFGRDMHCRTQRLAVAASKALAATKPLSGVSQPLGEAVGYACYVINSSNSGHPGPLNDAYWTGARRCTSASRDPECAATDPQSSIFSRPWLNSGRVVVAMELIATPVAGGWQFGDVSFLAYQTSGATLNGPANPYAQLLDSQDQPPPPAPYGPWWRRPTPGVCLACHGGRYQPAIAGSPPRVIGANFLPFDTATEIFRTDNPALTEAAQRDVIRQLNAFVQKTQPPQRAVSDLISGWYAWCGGVGKPGCYSDPVNHPFIPGDPALCSSGTFCTTTCDASRPAAEQSCGWWSGQPVNPSQKNGFNVRQFYTEVAAPLCRTCHVALADRFNVQDFDEWKSRAYDPVAVARTMPFAEVPYLNFSRNVKGQSHLGAKDFFDYFFASGSVPSPRQQCLSQCGTAQTCCTSACESGCIKPGVSCTSTPQVQSCRQRCAASETQCQSACPAF